MPIQQIFVISNKYEVKINFDACSFVFNVSGIFYETAPCLHNEKSCCEFCILNGKRQNWQLNCDLL